MGRTSVNCPLQFADGPIHLRVVWRADSATNPISPPLDAVSASSDRFTARLPKSSPLSSLECNSWIFFFAAASFVALLFCRLPPAARVHR